MVGRDCDESTLRCDRSPRPQPLTTSAPSATTATVRLTAGITIDDWTA
jgi:hypothetical protein